VIVINEFRGRDVAVFGLARSGLAAARALKAGGANVHAWDEAADRRAAAEAEGIPVEDINRRDWRGYAALILSPGIPTSFPRPHRVVELARMVGTPILSDIELFARAVNNLAPEARPRVIGITGTNGKSTTTALIAHLLTANNLDVRVGGNIGRGVLDLDPIHAGAIYVLELSSYQLELTDTLRCDAAVLLNITPDHLDRHGTMEAYIAAKARIFRNQRFGNPGVGDGNDAAIVGIDDAPSRGVCSRLSAQRGGDAVIPISARASIGRGIAALGGRIWGEVEGRTQAVVDLTRAPALKGRHNAQNAAAAYAVALHLGVAPKGIEEAMYSFPGLEHRMENVGKSGPILFVNDSKATNADAAAQALAVWKEGIHWIAGGVAKEGGIDALETFFPRVRRAYLIGQSASAFSEVLRGKVDCVIAGDLETAVQMAYADAEQGADPEPVILLSPACASQDQFRDFEHRGDVFRTVALELMAQRSERDEDDDILRRLA
jgi:UDP-N-acetylmuramoylalanine--D-glutamate ligase